MSREDIATVASLALFLIPVLIWTVSATLERKKR